VKIGGLKCDNPKCGFRDNTIKFSDYPLFINFPCPECGSVLLTQEDYNPTLQLIKVDKMAQVFKEKHPFLAKFLLRNYKVSLNGTGRKGMKIIRNPKNG
jgi:hypothetical protein